MIDFNLYPTRLRDDEYDFYEQVEDRDPLDPENKYPAIVNNDVDLILQQIDLLFETNPKEVLGDPDFGSQYDRYLYNLNISNEGLKSKVMSDLSQIELFGFSPNVEVYLLQGTEQDIALINIELTRNNEHYEKTYRIER